MEDERKIFSVNVPPKVRRLFGNLQVSFAFQPRTFWLNKRSISLKATWLIKLNPKDST